MSTYHNRSSLAFRSLLMMGLLALAAISLPSLHTSAAYAATATLTNTINTGAGSGWTPNTSPDPSGITFWSNSPHCKNDNGGGCLVVVDGEVEEMAIWNGANMFAATLTGALRKTWDLTDFNTEPVGVDIDIAIGPNGTIFISNDSKKTIFEIKLTSTGDLDKSTRRPIVTAGGANGFNNTDPEGLTLATIGGKLKLVTVDGGGAEVYITDAGSNGIFERSDQTTNWDTARHGIADPEGIEYDPRSGTFWIVDRRLDTLSELTVAGDLLQQFDLRPLLPTPSSQRNLADVTIANGKYYIVDRGVDNNNDPTENDGKIYEISLSGGTGGDTTKPTVSMTAPANGTTVSGTSVTVAANASDNVGVVGVQFKVGTTNLGAEDTTAPYEVVWNTTTLANGTYNVTAVARDAAGNTATATPVSVTVNNASTTLNWPNVRATPGNAQVILEWGAYSGAASYKVQRKVTGGSYSTVAKKLTALTYTDKTVTNGTTYCYRIQAVNSSGSNIARSNEICGVTPSAP